MVARSCCNWWIWTLYGSYHPYGWPIFANRKLGHRDLLSSRYRSKRVFSRKASHLTNNSQITNVLDILDIPWPHWPTYQELGQCDLLSYQYRSNLIFNSLFSKRWHVHALFDGFELCGSYHPYGWPIFTNQKLYSLANYTRWTSRSTRIYISFSM